MRVRTALLGVLLLIHTIPAHAVPAHQWSHLYQTEQSINTVGTCIADASGNLFLCGRFYSAINITAPFFSPNFHSDVIVAKFDPAGNPLWSKQLGFPYDDRGLSAATDGAGNVFVVGRMTPGVRNIGFITKYSPAGTQLWIKYLISQPDSLASADAITTDPAGHIYVAGRFDGSLNLGGSTLNSSTTLNLFVAEFDNDGNHMWSRGFNRSANARGFDDVTAIDVASGGQPVVVGMFTGTVNFGGGTLSAPDSLYKTYVARLDNGGAHMWSKTIPGGATLDIAATGRIGMTGWFSGSADFGGGPLTSAGQTDIFLAVFNPDGSHVWSKRFGGVSGESGYDVAFASNNDIMITALGGGGGSFSFGGSTFAAQVFHTDMFVARFFGSNGNHRWSTKVSGTNGNVQSGFIGETHGAVFLAGGFEGSPLDLGGGPLSGSGIFVAQYRDNLTAAGPTLARAQLLQNTPNPFNPQTTIAYTLTSAARVTIEIVDPKGAVVARLDEGVQPAGAHSTLWNGRDRNGHAAASGVYFYRMAGMPDVAPRKMVLLK